MKKSFLILSLMLFGYAASAQDIIVLQDASEIKAKVQKVTTTEISYQQWDNLNGPTYVLPKSKIFCIKYENGQKDVFSSTSTSPAVPAPSEVTTSAPSSTSASNAAAKNMAFANPRAGRITFQGYVNFAYFTLNHYTYGLISDVSFGARFYDYGYAGVEFGYDYLWGRNELYGWGGWYVPIGVNLRGYLPTRSKLYPFASLTLGCAIGQKTVFHGQALLGCDFSSFSIGIGWDRVNTMDSFICKIGIRFGL